MHRAGKVNIKKNPGFSLFSRLYTKSEDIMNALLETFLTHVMPLVSIENINPEAF